jgi:hypothetical protein
MVVSKSSESGDTHSICSLISEFLCGVQRNFVRSCCRPVGIIIFNLYYFYLACVSWQ